jgi:hypothetical protein
MGTNEELPWETDGDLPWETSGGDWNSADSEAWRGEVHLGEWPENLAGPEYWLYKQQEDDE